MYIILIPSYNPDEKLVQLVTELHNHKIILINDGSADENKEIFSKTKKLKNVTLISHQKNQGKGAAIKTGINYFLENFKEQKYQGIITVDADGQHSVQDVNMLIKKADLSKNSKKLLLGSRMDTSAMPLRSKFGNILTRFIFSLISKNKVCDTQTGLRAIPRSFFKAILAIESNGYELELEMLLLTKKNKIKIKEYPIATVYIDNNVSSHFDPIIDSLKIYFVFFRFIGNSILTALIDYSSFIIFNLLTGSIFYSFVVARFCACCFNFSVGKKLVFKSKNNIYFEISKYILLVIFLMIIAYYLVIFLITKFAINIFLAKILAEGGLFIVSFSLQHFFVFKKK